MTLSSSKLLIDSAFEAILIILGAFLIVFLVKLLITKIFFNKKKTKDEPEVNGQENKPDIDEAEKKRKQEENLQLENERIAQEGNNILLKAELEREKELSASPTKEITDLFFPRSLWIYFGVLVLLLPTAVLIANLFLNCGHLAVFISTTIASLAVSAFFIVRTIKKAWIPVPERDEVVVNRFEKYYGTRKKSGLCFPFPLFGWVDLYGVCTEDDDGLLFQVPNEDGTMKTAYFDLDDSSIPMIAKVFWRVEDSYKFIFGHEDSIQAMFEYVETFMRRAFMKEIDENGKSVKKLMGLKEALLFKSKDLIESFKGEDKEEGADFILGHWGIKVFKIMVLDFDLSEEQRNTLNQKLIKEQEAESAKAVAEGVFFKADGEARGIERLAKAENIRLTEIAKGQMSTITLLDGKVNPEQCLRHLQEMKKWENPNSININGDVGGGPGFGATLEAGRSAFNRRSNKEKKE